MNYDLEKVALAVGLVPCVIIEIPAIPEDFGWLAALLPVIKDLGVGHLNLHQLRLIPQCTGKPIDSTKIPVLTGEKN